MPDPGAEENQQTIAATYAETSDERQLRFRRDDRLVVIAQNREGYAMLAVRDEDAGEELERYYGLDMALDHAAEFLGVAASELTVPEEAIDLGM